MEQVFISDNVSVTVDTFGRCKWKQTEEDFNKGIVPFITYIGGNNWNKLDRMITHLRSDTKSHLRHAKHFKGIYRYELKIWGLSWEEMMATAQSLSPDTLRRDLKIVH